MEIDDLTFRYLNRLKLAPISLKKTELNKNLSSFSKEIRGETLLKAINDGLMNVSKIPPIGKGKRTIIVFSITKKGERLLETYEKEIKKLTT